MEESEIYGVDSAIQYIFDRYCTAVKKYKEEHGCVFRLTKWNNTTKKFVGHTKSNHYYGAPLYIKSFDDEGWPYFIIATEIEFVEGANGSYQTFKITKAFDPKTLKEYVPKNPWYTYRDQLKYAPIADAITDAITLYDEEHIWYY